MKDKLSSDVSMTLKLQTLVQVPLAIGAFMLAEPLLGILKADYVQVANVLRLLIIVAIFEGIENAVQNVLMGSEDSDRNINNLKFKILRKTWLFKLPLIDVFKSLFYVVGLAAIIFIFKDTTDNITLSSISTRRVMSGSWNDRNPTKFVGYSSHLRNYSFNANSME